MKKNIEFKIFKISNFYSEIDSGEEVSGGIKESIAKPTGKGSDPREQSSTWIDST